MSTNCLVTKIKSSVDNLNLYRFHEVRALVNTSSKVQLSGNGTVKLRTVGGITFSILSSSSSPIVSNVSDYTISLSSTGYSTIMVSISGDGMIYFTINNLTALVLTNGVLENFNNMPLTTLQTVTLNSGNYVIDHNYTIEKIPIKVMYLDLFGSYYQLPLKNITRKLLRVSGSSVIGEVIDYVYNNIKNNVLEGVTEGAYLSNIEIHGQKLERSFAYTKIKWEPTQDSKYLITVESGLDSSTIQNTITCKINSEGNFIE